MKKRGRPPVIATPTTQIAMRLPTDWVSRVDALAQKFSRPGITVSRSEALRAVMIKGLEVLEAEPTQNPKPKGRSPLSRASSTRR